MLIIFGEKNLVDRHTDMLKMFNHNTEEIISVYENEEINIDFSKAKYILLCSQKGNKKLKLHILKTTACLHKIYLVNDSYPSAMVFYYIRINNLNYNNISIIEFLKLLTDSFLIEECKNVIYNKYDIYDLKYYTNKNFNKTNMVFTLFCAKDFMDDDIIISYSDIIYEKEVLEELINNTDDISVVVDKKWKELWNQRMENPLDDAETLIIKNGKIIQLGKKTNDYNKIEAQYIGLIKISKNVISTIIKLYESLDKNKLYDEMDFDNMYMTSFIQIIIDNLYEVNPVFISGGWIEIDSINDLNSKIVN